MKKLIAIAGLVALAITVAPFAFAGLPAPDMVALQAAGPFDTFPVEMFGLAGILVNKDSLNAVFNGLKTLFNNALKAQPGNWQATAMEVQSTGKGEDYAWLSRFPKMRKWVGEKLSLIHI